MTLIVGILTDDGVVVASDGDATLGSMGQMTVRQQTNKLSIIQDKIIVGVSGPVGLGQIIVDTIDKLYSDGSIREKIGAEAMSIIADKIRVPIFKEIDAAKMVQDVKAIGPGVAAMSAISQTLMAVPLSGTPHLFQFDQQGSPEMANDGLPFVAIGSGQQIADPFLAFVRKVVWKDQDPKLGDAIFAAIWTIHHVIETNPGGISEPIEVAILSKNGHDWIARKLTEDEMTEHRESIKNMEDYIGEFIKPVPEATEDLPKIPKLEKEKK